MVPFLTTSNLNKVTRYLSLLLNARQVLLALIAPLLALLESSGPPEICVVPDIECQGINSLGLISFNGAYNLYI